MKRYKNLFKTMIFLTVILYAAGVGLDICPNLRIFIKTRFVNICLADKMDDMLGLYGIIWTVTTGTVVFVIQHGYANVLGLSMIEILEMVIHKPVLVCTGAMILCRAAMFFVLYLLEMKCTMAFGIAELTLQLLFIGYCFFSLPNIETVKKILIVNRGNKIKNDEKILIVAKRMNYNETEECEALVEIVAASIRQLQELDWDIEKPWDKAKAADLINQEEFINEVVRKMYYGAGKRCGRILYLMENVLVHLKDVSTYKKYVFLNSILEINVRTIPPQKMIDLLYEIEEKDRIEILKKLIVHMKFVYKMSEGAKKAFCKIIMKELYKEYVTYGCTKQTTNWKSAADVFFIKYQQYRIEEKTDESSRLNDTVKMKMEYARFINE